MTTTAKGVTEAIEFAKQALEDAAEELRLIRMKDSDAVYDPVLRSIAHYIKPTWNAIRWYAPKEEVSF